MFVSPPPATSTIQVLQKKRSKRGKENSNSLSSQYNNQLQSIADNNSINNVGPNQFIPRQQEPEGSMTSRPVDGQEQMNRKDASNFVSAPPEYSDRARLEIRKRLLPTANNKINRLPNKDNNYSNEHNSRQSLQQDNTSILSENASSYQSSIFSHPSTVFTASTTDSGTISIPKYVTEITLEDALPKTFYDMYSPEVLMSDPSNILYNGRPKFTKRELLDWDLNDIRSLLIVEKLRPEWGNQLPRIVTNGINLPQFRLQLLPLRSMDNFIIKVLVESDLYLEANLDYEFKLTSAKYTVASARRRHEEITGRNEPIMNLSKPEWRNIIENYLLNISVEAQCRFDFKQRCSEFKKWKLQQSNLKRPDMPPPSIIPAHQTPHNNNNLLKKALMKNLQLKNFNGGDVEHGHNKNSKSSSTNMKVSLSKEEKANIWSQCQAQVYQRLGLDWQPDGIVI
ncbi:hypothetical protein NCAS_0G00600 [Naumovozyma castellii]|uniref:Uncharacterized protein n=1 Tax=Naumovozyma castellii TaxID=27288 RepID=G0VHR3_NAUCA|nr:hypothetical protein NCAS_0G00600 [Naumovozyma castellii CBS 4309]CCC70947.1 hypothetical protein NCAS_0G00600 [Naumovozyma castellii CBS 4309]